MFLDHFLFRKSFYWVEFQPPRLYGSALKVPDGGWHGSIKPYPASRYD